MTSNFYSSTGTFDGHVGSSSSNSIVGQTTDIFNRLRNSLIRNRKERLLDEDVQATENIVSQLHFTGLMAKETLTKLLTQGDSMHRSHSLINQLQREIKDIAEDLNKVNGRRFFGACFNGTCFGFACLGCLNRKEKKSEKNNRRQPYDYRATNKKKPSHALKSIERNFDSLNQACWSSSTEREEVIARTRALARQRREHTDFINITNLLKDIQRKEAEVNDQNQNKSRNHLFQHHSLAYGQIDQPERLMNEIDLAIHFTQLSTHLDRLLQMTEIMTNEVDKHNSVINKIEMQAMESGALLTDYTLLGHNILGASPTPIKLITNTHRDPPNHNALGITNGQKVLLNSVL